MRGDVALGSTVLGRPGAERPEQRAPEYRCPQNATPPLAVGVNDAARLLGVSRDTIYRLINSGKLKSVKLGGRRVVPIRELERLLEEEVTP